ncbi:hypothetical protein [Brucella sp. IR073]|uniref:hypothetical protein n=1 Tax=unclassified Brucella TaxID=2632610 RepID=UPI003B987762
MRENVVASLLNTGRQRVKSEISNLQAEDAFYKEFGDPLPRWLRVLGRLLARRC